ncbi:MAG: hypothetical protein ACXVP7_12985, partial [Actinomycetota bacterium]
MPEVPESDPVEVCPDVVSPPAWPVWVVWPPRPVSCVPGSCRWVLPVPPAWVSPAWRSADCCTCSIAVWRPLPWVPPQLDARTWIACASGGW